VDGGAVEGTLKIRRNRKIQFMNASLVGFLVGRAGVKYVSQDVPVSKQISFDLLWSHGTA
jgi:hypothetical protein